MHSDCHQLRISAIDVAVVSEICEASWCQNQNSFIVQWRDSLLSVMVHVAHLQHECDAQVFSNNWGELTSMHLCLRDGSESSDLASGPQITEIMGRPAIMIIPRVSLNPQAYMHDAIACFP